MKIFNNAVTFLTLVSVLAFAAAMASAEVWSRMAGKPCFMMCAGGVALPSYGEGCERKFLTRWPWFADADGQWRFAVGNQTPSFTGRPYDPLQHYDRLLKTFGRRRVD